MPDCRYFEELISRRLDERLEPDQTVELDAHLESCASCREFADTIARHAAIAAELPTLTTNRQLRIEPVSRMQRLWRSRIAVPVPLAAALIAIAIGLGVFARTESQCPPRPQEPSVDIIELPPVATVRQP